MPTIFNLFTDNAEGTINLTGALNNTTDPIAVALQAGQGARFPSPSGGAVAPVEIYSRPNFGDNPLADPQKEKAFITSRATDTLTLSRPNAVAHTGYADICGLWDAASVTQIQTAINELEEGADPNHTVDSQAADFNIGTTDDVFLVDTSSANVTATLPAASADLIGKTWRLYKTDAANTLIVAITGGDSLNGTASTTVQHSWIDIMCVTATAFQVGVIS